jgi:hypothetical protein
LGSGQGSAAKGSAQPPSADRDRGGAKGGRLEGEVVDIIEQHFNLLRYEFHVIRTSFEPFLLIFSEKAARGRVFARGRVVDGPTALCFHSWDVDPFGERVLLPYHVKLSIEGLPHHAWLQDIVEKVVGDDAVIHHVDQSTRRRTYMRFFVCWAFCQNPSQLPQLVYLTLTDRLGDPNIEAQLHFTRPRNTKRGQVFKVLIHLDSVEDLMFYHQPLDQLRADGQVQLREFRWIPGRPDGDIEDEDDGVVQRYSRPVQEPRRRPREDDDEEGARDRSRFRGRDLLGSVSRFFDSRRRQGQSSQDRGRANRCFCDVSPRRRRPPSRSASPLPLRANSPAVESSALRQLWSAKKDRIPGRKATLLKRLLLCP